MKESQWLLQETVFNELDEPDYAGWLRANCRKA